MKFKVTFENLAGVKTTVIFTAESIEVAATIIKEYRQHFPIETKDIREIEEVFCKNQL